MLDNTGSMAGTKLETLKTAATDPGRPAPAEDQRHHRPAVAEGLGGALLAYGQDDRLDLQGRDLDGSDGARAWTSDIFNTANTNRYTMLSNLGQKLLGLRGKPGDAL